MALPGGGVPSVAFLALVLVALCVRRALPSPAPHGTTCTECLNLNLNLIGYNCTVYHRLNYAAAWDVSKTGVQEGKRYNCANYLVVKSIVDG